MVFAKLAHSDIHIETGKAVLYEDKTDNNNHKVGHIYLDDNGGIVLKATPHDNAFSIPSALLNNLKLDNAAILGILIKSITDE